MSMPLQGGWLLQVVFGLGLAALAFLTLWSLAKTALTPPGQPPDSSTWISRPSYAGRRRHDSEPLEGHDQEREERPLRWDRVLRYCKHCCDFKPDRTHHCSVLNQCVLRFDHFCPWVGNTVGWRNHKFFLLFCGYCGALGVFALVCSALSLMLRTWFDMKIWVRKKERKKKKKSFLPQLFCRWPPILCLRFLGS